MSNNAVALTQDFQTKLFERIRDGIGELMTDEDLKRLVEAGMQKALFEERISYDNYHNRQEVLKPAIQTIVADLLKDNVRKAVNQWLSDNPDTVTKAIQELVSLGIVGIIQSHIEQKAQQPLWELSQRLQQVGILR